MSKSKGNTLDPMDLIHGISQQELIAKRSQGLMQPQMAARIQRETAKEFPQGIQSFGSDALRFTFASLASLGRDIRFDFGRLEGYRHFCNKIWNAARFIFLQTEGKPLISLSLAEDHLGDSERYILSQLQQLIADCHLHFKQMRFDLATQALYQFIWHDYCDWYLEFAKIVLNNDDFSEENKAIARYTLLYTLEQLLRLLHPFMPFITEDIWQRLRESLALKAESISLTRYPEHQQDYHFAATTKDIKWLQQVISCLRSVRAEMHISPKNKLTVFYQTANSHATMLCHKYRLFIQQLTGTKELAALTNDKRPAGSITSLSDDISLTIPLQGLVDVKQEMQRLEKTIAKLEKSCAKSQQKLDNPQYLARAPQALVSAERKQLAKQQQQMTEYQQQYQELAAIE